MAPQQKAYTNWNPATNGHQLAATGFGETFIFSNVHTTAALIASVLRVVSKPSLTLAGSAITLRSPRSAKIERLSHRVVSFKCTCTYTETDGTVKQND